MSDEEKLAICAKEVVASWDSSKYYYERPDCMMVNVNREAWARFCELVESE